MLYPPIDSLLEKIDSKYSLVSVASKRARSIKQDNKKPLIKDHKSFKNVGIALEEIHSGILDFELPKE